MTIWLHLSRLWKKILTKRRGSYHDIAGKYKSTGRYITGWVNSASSLRCTDWATAQVEIAIVKSGAVASLTSPGLPIPDGDGRRLFTLDMADVVTDKELLIGAASVYAYWNGKPIRQIDFYPSTQMEMVKRAFGQRAATDLTHEVGLEEANHVDKKQSAQVQDAPVGHPPEPLATAHPPILPGGKLEELARSEVASYIHDFRRSKPTEITLSNVNEGIEDQNGSYINLGSTISEAVARQYLSFGKTSMTLFNYTIANCLLDAPTLLLFNADGVLPASQYLVPEDPKVLLATNRPVARALHRAKSALGYNRGYKNYYHWMMQCLPAIFSYYQEDISNDELVILLPHLSPVQQRSIDLLSCVGKTNWIDSRSQYIFGELRYSDFLSGASSRRPSPLVRAMVRRLISKKDPLYRRESGEIIYISRVDTKNRIMINEADLILKLGEAGVSVITLNGLDLDEQIDIFRGARLVVGPHGAGLTNLIFCESGTVLYELLPRHYINGCYGEAAFAYGIHYWADIFETLDDSDAGRHQRRWMVDIDYVLMRVNQIRTHHNI